MQRKARAAALVNLFVLRWQTAVLFADVTQEFSSNMHAKKKHPLSVDIRT
jgi:hypothetical protein